MELEKIMNKPKKIIAKVVFPITCICATPYKRKLHRPKRFIFETKFQNDVENIMAELGYGADQYFLSFATVAELYV